MDLLSLLRSVVLRLNASHHSKPTQASLIDIRAMALPLIQKAFADLGLAKQTGLRYTGILNEVRVTIDLDAVSFECSIEALYPAPLPVVFRAQPWFVDSGGWPDLEDDPPPPHDPECEALVHEGFFDLGVVVSKGQEGLLRRLPSEQLAVLYKKLQRSGPPKWTTEGIAFRYSFSTLHPDPSRPIFPKAVSRLEGDLIRRGLPRFKDFVRDAVELERLFFARIHEITVGRVGQWEEKPRTF